MAKKPKSAASKRRGEQSARRKPGRMAAPPGPGPWLQVVFDRSGLGLGRLDVAARILEGNDAFSQFFGRSVPDLRGRSLTELAVADSAEAVDTLAREATSSEGTASCDVRFVRHDGTLAWASLTLTATRAPDEPGFIAMLQDVSARKAREAELLHRAFHDALTGLPNRALLLDRVDHAMAHGARAGECVGILFIDLDDFKAINDTQGHSSGDRILQHVAETLLAATRGCDTVARLGGDEFAVLLERLNKEEGPEVAAQRIVNALARPVEVQPGRAVTVRASIGIAVHEPGEGRDELLRNADVALYEAKSRSRGRWVAYDPAMHAALVDRVALESDLRTAIERCQLEDRPNLEATGAYPRYRDTSGPAEISISYQPIVDVASERLIGFEALLRWAHGERGPIPPATFVPMAEETGLIRSLGRWVIRQACRQAGYWNARMPGLPLSVTVNLSGCQLHDEALALDVERALAESGLPASQLILELTESTIMREPRVAETRLTELKRLGVHIAIDDFGTGYSSLSHLQRFPVDILKIDQSFLHRMRQGSHDAALVRTIVALARMLSLRTIAEGVEDSSQQSQLRELGCDSAQGFLFGRPMTVNEVDELLASGPAFERIRLGAFLPETC
jgi:diguanylate cyclase (GGDEF)-like protein/PAS domain S-box-containing protein